MEKKTILPAEWAPQSAVQLTWPHEETDWAPILDEVIPCFVAIAKEIIKREKLLIVCPDEQAVRAQLGDVDYERIRFYEMETNDTWARDLCHMGAFADEVVPANMQPFVLEGGSIESDGKGTLMTTVECLSSVNRNEYLDQEALEHYLKDVFGLDRILWINSGYLAGDDTDSHVDTLARFCDEQTIAYVRCTDEADEHYAELHEMEQEIQSFTQADGTPYRLIALPMADKVEWEGERLPATYANFLIVNGAVLLPFYNSPKDEEARSALQAAFPDREIVGINCLPLIKQHGSLHCVTMQYPEGYIL